MRVLFFTGQERLSLPARPCSQRAGLMVCFTPTNDSRYGQSRRLRSASLPAEECPANGTSLSVEPGSRIQPIAIGHGLSYHPL